MNPLYCNICADVKSATRRLVALKQIDRILIEEVKQPPREESISKISLEIPHENVKNYFMCGNCYKFNAGEMARLNNSIREKIVWLCYRISTNTINQNMVKQIKENLRGYFPQYYKIIEKYQLKYYSIKEPELTILGNKKSGA